MKRTIVLLTALGLLAGAVLAPAAQASWRLTEKKMNPKRVEMPAELRGPARFDAPTMQFLTGTLRREGLADWWFGDYRLQLGADATIVGPDGEGSYLQEGRQVAVMGALNGNTVSGWSVRLLGDEMPLTSGDDKVIRTPSDSDPDVGVMTGGPR